MSKKWGEHSADEQMTVYNALAAIYEEAGHPEGLKNPSCTSEYVNIMMAK